MIEINKTLTPLDLKKKLERFWRLSAKKLYEIEKKYDVTKGSPVFTVDGVYSTRGWTEWTQGFQFGSEILQFDATGEKEFLLSGREHALRYMAPHVSHTGVHDHGFNNVSTYGNLLRLMLEGKTAFDQWEKNFYELALKISGAVQAGRWTEIKEGGFIHSFNGKHSLFVDTIRTIRVLMISHLLGHTLQGENDKKINLLDRALMHARATADFSVFYGEGRDSYDVRGRTAHECIFNVKDGNYRCPNAQQGYSGFTTWTRGLAWAMTGFAEEVELIDAMPESAFEGTIAKQEALDFMLKAARATCDFYLHNSPSDGIPYWDTGAPGLYKLGDYLNRPAEPFNDYEPVDSSAAAIGVQGLLRLGNYLSSKGEKEEGAKYFQVGLTIMATLLDEPYLSTDPEHQGLILHSIYHQPNGWDHVPEGQKIACGESSMWGDYHAREAAIYLQRMINNEKYYTFWSV